MPNQLHPNQHKHPASPPTARSTARQARRARHAALISAAAISALASAGAGSLAAATGAGAATAALGHGSSSTALQAVSGGAPARIPAGYHDLGAASGDARISLDVVLKPRDPAALTALANEVSTPGTPLYRHYLAKGQFASTFGPATASVNAVRDELSAEGVKVGALTDGLILHVAATVGQVDKAFGADMHSIRSATGQTVMVNDATVTLPANIASTIQGVVGLNGLNHYESQVAGASVPGRSGIMPTIAGGGPSPCSAAGGHGYTAANISQAYDMNPLYAAGDYGAGQSVDLYELAPFESSDISSYQACYGTSVPIKVHTVDGGSIGPPTQGASAEDEVDIEDVIGLAPKLAAVHVYEGPNTGGGIIDTYAAIAAANDAKVISSSWMGCETTSNYTGEEPFLQQMAVQGQSFFNASGDSGSENCKHGVLGVTDPGSQVYVTGVGGTNLNSVNNPPASRPSETAWEGSGGGISQVWTMPSWQLTSVPGVKNPYTSGAPCGAAKGKYCREMPDVSADAGSSYAMITGGPVGSWGSWIGTSLASPTWAAITALIDDSTAKCRTSAVGFLDPALYKLAGSTPADFNDITVGNNAHGDPLLKGKYPATKGYDLATGLGTPEAANLAQSLCGASLWTEQGTDAKSALTSGPALAAAGGVLYVAYVNSPTGKPATISYQTYNGVSWSAVSTVDPGGTPANTVYSPAIALNGKSPMVGWTDASTNKVEVSTLSGGKWSSAVAVGGGSALSDNGPALSSGAAVMAAWKGKSDDSLWVSTLSKGSWTGQQEVPGMSCATRPAAIFFPPLGAFVMACTTSKGVMQFDDDSFLGFGSAVSISGSTSYAPALTVVGKRIYVAWLVSTGAIEYSANTAGDIYGGTWTKAQTLPNALTSNGPALAATGPTLYAAWSGKGSGTQQLWFSATDPPQS
jgi:hypothetical protein